MAQSPNGRQIREVLSELLSMADHDLRHVTADPEFALAHAWFVRSVDNINAVLALHDQGLGRAADPLVRSAIEHAVGVVWLRELGQAAIQAVGRNHKRWATNIQTAISVAKEQPREQGHTEWSPELDEVLNEVAAQETPTGAVDGERRIVERFRVAKEFDLYVAWLSETANSHATQVSAAPYLVAGADRHQLLRTPRSRDDRLVLRCAAVAVLAFRAMSDALNSEYWRANVDRLDEQLGSEFADALEGDFGGAPSDDWLTRFN
jgi:hypothetical protein